MPDESRTRRPGRTRRRYLGGAALVVLAALVAVGALVAGGEDEPEKGPPGSPSNPLVALPNPQPARTPQPLDGETAQTPEQSAAEDPEGARRPEPLAGTRERAEGRAPRAPRQSTRRARKQPRGPTVSLRRPCTLVTKAQAQALVGEPLEQPQEAPQGPTCIYRARSGDAFVTVAVQRARFESLRARLPARRRLTVAGRIAYCGRLGQPLLYVRLSANRVLTVSAPCALARRFAARALARLGR